MLKSLFWVDEIAKQNYKEFGDVISFDGTFRTNKYKLIFVPFTGIDNHKKSVTFGAALLSSETTYSYQWLLQSFLKVHQRQPLIVLSDQDAALGQAIATVFTGSKHRLCVWHIMMKLNTKVGINLLISTNFREKLNKLVWDQHIGVEEFEQKWVDLIKEFHLEDNGWLNMMFSIRSHWVSAYFKDIPMSGLMKTTSRSENTNSFFNTFLHEGDTFVSFMSCFDAAMEKQRYNQRYNDHISRTKMPGLKTPKKIEEHAAEVYTHEVFLDVQKQMYKAGWNCVGPSDISKEGRKELIMVEKNDQGDTKGHFQVVLNEIEQTIICTCNRFLRNGILCCHIFRVFFDYNIEKIPDAYIVRRWEKNLLPASLLRRSYVDVDLEFERNCTKAQTIIYDCLDLARDNKEKMAVLFDEIEKLKDKLKADLPAKVIPSKKKEIIQSILGVQEPKNVEITVPIGIGNKGTGKGKRLIGAVEKAMASGSSRKCKTCHKYGHDSRICPQKNQRKL